MSIRDPKLSDSAASNDTEAQPLFTAQERAALRRDLAPSSVRRAHVRETLLSNVAIGMLTPSAQRVDVLLHGHAASVVGAKVTAAGALHALSTKIVVVSLVLAGGATAVVLRGTPEARPEVSAAEHTTKLAPVGEPSASASAREAQAAEPPTQQVPAPAAATSTPEAQAAEPPVQQVPALAAATSAREAQAAEPQTPQVPALAAPSRRKAGRRAAAVAPHELDRPQLRAAVAPEQTPMAAADEADEQVVQEELATNPSPEPTGQATTAPRTPEPPAAELPEAQASQAPSLQLSGELALMKLASDALRRRDVNGALRTLQRYEAQFPRGALRVEYQALRAMALCQAHSADSTAVSEQFVRAHPHSALAERVQHACSERAQDNDHVTP